MKLAILMTARCNAACSHCSTSCGPRRDEHLSRDELFALMDQSMALSPDQADHEFMLSGGEPFLDYDLLLALVAHGKNRGASVTCVTNGYWASSHERALELLAPLQAAGLTALAVSSSRFHQPYIKPRRVERVLAAARELGLHCTLKYVRVRSDEASEAEVRQWALQAGAAVVQDFPLLPHLRDGKSLPEEEYLREPGLPQGRCPAPVLTVGETGVAYACSSPGARVGLLKLGDIRRQPLDQIQNRFYLGGAQQLLRQHGPAYFARAIEARGEDGRLRRAYCGECDLCTHIATEPVLSAIAAEMVEVFEAAQAQALLQQLFQPAAAPAGSDF